MWTFVNTGEFYKDLEDCDTRVYPTFRTKYLAIKGLNDYPDNYGLKVSYNVTLSSKALS